MIIKQAYIRILDTASDGEGNTYNDCLSDELKEIWKKNMERVFPEILDQIEKIL